MAKTEFEPSIKSRPTYGEFEVKEGSSNLFVANAEGAEAILDLIQSADAAFWAKSHIIYVTGRSGDKYVEDLRALGAPKFYVGPSNEPAISRLSRALEDERMGMQIYLSGTEGLMGLARRAAMQAGVPHEFIQTEHRGSMSRRVQCVHCKGTTEEVTTDPYVCSHCGLNLFVRDHYSRRLAAFQGVNIDAEDPGNVPEQEERFL